MKKYIVSIIMIVALISLIALPAFALVSTVDSTIDLSKFESGHLKDYTFLIEISDVSCVVITSDRPLFVYYDSKNDCYDLCFDNGKSWGYEVDGERVCDVIAFGKNFNSYPDDYYWSWSGYVSDKNANDHIFNFLNGKWEYPYYSDYDVFKFDPVTGKVDKTDCFFFRTASILKVPLTQELGTGLQEMRRNLIQGLMILVVSLVGLLALRKVLKILRDQLLQA